MLPDQSTLLAALVYLMPAAVLWVLLRGLSGSTVVYSILSLPGTFMHELLHLLVGTLTNAKPVSFSLLPKTDGTRRLVMGNVGFANIRWYNALPTCLAPLLGVYVVLLVAVYRVGNGYVYQRMDILIWCLLAPQFSSIWPSQTDWKISLRAWPVYLLAMLVLVATGVLPVEPAHELLLHMAHT